MEWPISWNDVKNELEAVKTYADDNQLAKVTKPAFDVEWDGNAEGRDTASDGFFVKVSDQYLSVSELEGRMLTVTSDYDGEIFSDEFLLTTEGDNASMAASPDGNLVIQYDAIFVFVKEPCVWNDGRDDIIFPSAGCYVMCMVRSLHIKAEIEPINPDFLPPISGTFVTLDLSVLELVKGSDGNYTTTLLDSQKAIAEAATGPVYVKFHISDVGMDATAIVTPMYWGSIFALGGLTPVSGKVGLITIQDGLFTLDLSIAG